MPNETKIESLSIAQGEDSSRSLLENPGKLKIAGTALALGGLAAVGYDIQASGLTYSIPDHPRLITDSMRHPVLGYVGAAAGHLATTIAARLSKQEASTKAKLTGMFVGATAANFGAEQAQSMFYAIDEYKNYFSAQQTPETIKDYVFALGGLVLYRRQSRPKQFRMSRWSQAIIALKVAQQRRQYLIAKKTKASTSRQNHLQQYA